MTTGAGLDDLTSGGTYTATADHTYEFIISTEAAADKFKWRVDGGAWSAEVEITGAAQSIENGLEITFGAVTGHTKDDVWTVICTAGQIIHAETLDSLIVNVVGTGATLQIYNGDGTDGVLLLSTSQASWVAGRKDSFGILASSGHLYVVLKITGNAPDLIIGTN